MELLFKDIQNKKDKKLIRFAVQQPINDCLLSLTIAVDSSDPEEFPEHHSLHEITHTAKQIALKQLRSIFFQ